MVEEGLKVIDPRRKDEADFIESMQNQRKKYAPMQAHREMAAQVLAVGGTMKMAAMRAGVSQRQIRKYYQDADFRQRIEELRTTMLSRVRGRVMRELARRTEPGKVERIELLDLLRIFDRVEGTAPASRGRGFGVEVNVQNNNYDTLVSALLTPDSGSEVADFPLVELEGTAVSSRDS